jgi:hypothetical protein
VSGLFSGLRYCRQDIPIVTRQNRGTAALDGKSGAIQEIKMTKTTLFALMLACSATAFAQQKSEEPAKAGGADKAQKLQQVKQQMTDRIDRRIEALQKAKACVQNAQGAKALRACRAGSAGK